MGLTRKEVHESILGNLNEPKIAEGDEGKIESRDLRELVAVAEYLDKAGEEAAALAGKKRCLFQKIRADSAID